MKLQTLALSMALALAAAPLAAQDKMAKDPMMKPPTMQECKDMMAMPKDGMKKDDATMMKMKSCDDMMKKGDSMKGGDAMAPKK